MKPADTETQVKQLIRQRAEALRQASRHAARAEKIAAQVVRLTATRPAP